MAEPVTTEEIITALRSNDPDLRYAVDAYLASRRAAERFVDAPPCDPEAQVVLESVLDQLIALLPEPQSAERDERIRSLNAQAQACLM